jgi:hypothetical protein
VDTRRPLKARSFERRLKEMGMFTISQSDYIFVRCQHCGCLYVLDDELRRLFYKPNDLYFNFYVVPDGNGTVRRYEYPCRCCDDANWDFDIVDMDEKESVSKSEWNWAL